MDTNSFLLENLTCLRTLLGRIGTMNASQTLSSNIIA